MKTEKSSTYNHLKRLAERKWMSGYIRGSVTTLLIFLLGLLVYDLFFKRDCAVAIRQVPHYFWIHRYP